MPITFPMFFEGAIVVVLGTFCFTALRQLGCSVWVHSFFIILPRILERLCAANSRYRRGGMQHILEAVQEFLEFRNCHAAAYGYWSVWSFGFSCGLAQVLQHLWPPVFCVSFIMVVSILPEGHIHLASEKRTDGNLMDRDGGGYRPRIDRSGIPNVGTTRGANFPSTSQIDCNSEAIGVLYSQQTKIMTTIKLKGGNIRKKIEEVYEDLLISAAVPSIEAIIDFMTSYSRLGDEEAMFIGFLMILRIREVHGNLKAVFQKHDPHELAKFGGFGIPPGRKAYIRRTVVDYSKVKEAKGELFCNGPEMERLCDNLTSKLQKFVRKIIPCENMKRPDRFCPYGDNCHYLHPSEGAPPYNPDSVARGDSSIFVDEKES